MPPHRFGSLVESVTLEVDGRAVPALEGESVALALLAHGRLVFGRSAKYHRPRGATCLSGRCDGCLMRVDGRPNRRTCRVPARDGMKVETQNVVGSADADLLSVTDWFFPKGMDHHHMFTRFGGLNRTMQKVARRIAGLGELPEEIPPSTPLRRLTPEVLVVGGGPAGHAAARAAQQAGAHVHLVTEGVGHPQNGLDCDLGTTVVAAYAGADAPGGLALLALSQADELTLFLPRVVVLATGLVRGSLLFEGNDHPAVFTADAALRALHGNVSLGQRPVLVGRPGDRAAALRQSFAVRGIDLRGPISPNAIAGISGRKRLKAVRLKDGKQIETDALLVDAPASAAYELAGQLGANVQFDGSGFFVVPTDDHGTISTRAFVCGGLVGARKRQRAIAQGAAAGRAAGRRVQKLARTEEPTRVEKPT